MAEEGVETAPLLTASSSGVHRKRRVRPLSLLPLVALIFYDVSGGPFGIEDAVSSGGPLLAIIGFIVLPFIWSVPEALVTAELATAFPEDSGYVAWVTAAFGPFWGFQEGFWSWLSGVTDNSLYPVMFLSYLAQLVPVVDNGWLRIAFLFLVSAALSYLNYRGLTIVGAVAVGMTFFIILPFLVLTALAVPHIDPANWLQQDWQSVDWSTFLNVMFWNLNYWDSVSTLAGEVQHPRRTFPKALLMGVVLVVAMYLIPLLVGLGVTTNASAWELGYFAKVAEMVGGPWLGWWMLAAAAISQIGQFEAEMSSDSYQLLGMAQRGFLPARLAERSRHGTPTLAIILSSLGVISLVTFDFLQIVELLNVVYCMAELLEFAAFIWLRIKAPEFPRPYMVPVPTWGAVLMLLPASGLLLTLLIMPILRLDVQVMSWTAGAIVVGALLYPLLNLARDRGWCEFRGLPHEYQDFLRSGLPKRDFSQRVNSQRVPSDRLPSQGLPPLAPDVEAAGVTEANEELLEAGDQEEVFSVNSEIEAEYDALLEVDPDRHSLDDQARSYREQAHSYREQAL